MHNFMSFGKLSMLCHHHSLILHLHCTKKKPCAHLQSFSLPTPGQAKQPLIFLLPWICLVYILDVSDSTDVFHINGVIPLYGLLCLASFTMFLRFVHIVACVRTPFFLIVEQYAAFWAPLVAQRLKSPPAVQETRV